MSKKCILPMSLPAEVINAIPIKIESGIRTEWVMITPEMATKWLEECNQNNRTIREHWVTRLANDMASGKWRGRNGEAIRFDSANRLIDGQHRLWACIQSNTPFESAVMYGLDTEDYKTIGIGASKSFADFLGPVHGEKNTTLYASSVRMVFCWSRGILHNMKDGRTMPTIMDLEICYKDHPHLKESVHWVASLSSIKGLLIPAYAVLIHYSAYCTGVVGTAEDFLSRVGSGLGLLEDSPTYQLRRHLTANQLAKRGRGKAKEDILALTIKAWNMVKEGKKTKDLRFRTGEEFPTL